MRRRLTVLGLLAPVLLAGLVALADAGNKSARYRGRQAVSAADVVRALHRSGLRIELRPLRSARDAVTVSGFARLRHQPRERGVHYRVRVGFEFAVARVPNASTTMLGRAGRGFPQTEVGVQVRPQDGNSERITRGILHNVAYANYFYGKFAPDTEADTRLVRRLDDALFGLFGRRDPDAQPIFRRP